MKIDESFFKLWKKNFPWVIILFLGGIIFLMGAEYDSSKEGAAREAFQESEYTKDLEARLAAMLEEMDGVEDVKVMITLEGSSRYCYESGAKDGSLLTGASINSAQEPILSYVGTPVIKGVSVVCKGADNLLIREKIFQLVSGTLNLSKNKIYVTE